MNILIVDDDPSTLECLTEAVRMYGHTPYACSTVEDATRALPYVEAVLTDGLRGHWEALASHVRNVGKPVVVYSADDDIVEQARCEGFPAFLKPERIERILEELTGDLFAEVE